MHEPMHHPSALLRPWSATDADALLAAQRENDDLATQFGPLADHAAAARFIEKTLRMDDTVQHWAVVVDGVAVGNVGLSAIEHRHDTAWVSYWLATVVRGRGLASRAVAAVAQRAFDDGSFRLELGHRVNNPASCRVAVAAGFAPEGVERLKLRYGQERFDVETHARLAVDPVPDVEPLGMLPPR